MNSLIQKDIKGEFTKPEKEINDAIAEIEEAFYMFKVRSLCRKNRAQEGLFPYGKYKEWCIEERNSIDKIMIKFDLFDRG